MRLTYLVEDLTRIWGGVRAVIDAANALHARGHAVTIVAKSGPPAWTQVDCELRANAAFTREHIPESDVVVATYWTTVQSALEARRGIVAHYCQGYEGDNPECAPHRARIEQVYHNRQTRLLAISPHLSALLGRKFGRVAREVVYAVDHRTLHAGPPRAPGRPLRVGLVGPYDIEWKDIRTGIEACRLAHKAGLDLQLVRVTNTARHRDEASLGVPHEWHERVPPARMGDIYRSLDVFLGTSRGDEEGFFLPAVEAMACGVPCVLTDIPCHRGYGDGQYALFVAPRDPAQMAEGLVLASAHAGLRAELRENGLRVAARHRLEAHVDDLEQAFAEMLLGQPAGVGPQGACAPPRRDHGAARVAAAAREAVIACEDLGSLDEIATRLTAVLRAELEHRRGVLEYERGDFRAARASLTSALASAVLPAEVYNDLGVAHFAAGEHDLALGAFQRALEIDPVHKDARANLADVSAVARR